jgi:hypothetical protein
MGAGEHSLDSCIELPPGGPGQAALHSTEEHVGSSNKSNNSSSIPKGTIQWLREKMKHPEAYNSKLTKFPEKWRSSQHLPWAQRRVSEPVQGVKNMSPRPSDPEPKVDATGFRQVVSDLQKLLDEAMTIANQVVDRPPVSNHDVSQLSTDN